MGRRPKVPWELTKGPFTTAHAEAAGLERWHLEGEAWKRIGPRTYRHADTTETPLMQLQAAALRLPPEAAFSGATAAWLHGLGLNPCDPIEVSIPKHVGVAARAGMAVRRTAFGNGDVVEVRGLRATSVRRAVREACARLPLTEAVVVCDLALHARLVRVGELDQELSRAAGARGIVTLRRALQYVEPLSESPMETRLRMLLVLAGLPRPQAQVPIRNRFFKVVGRPDLYYPERRLGLEYDGTAYHQDLADDNRRQNLLLGAGVRLLRFTAGDIYNTPEIVVSQVRSALAA